MRLTKLFGQFFESEKAAGLILLFCTALSLLLANSAVGESYVHFWHTNVGGQSLEYWINDGLMTIFFLMIGLELEREIYKGELSQVRHALFPAIGAIGGMALPALLFWLLNKGTAFADGVGIPMATDIAFALGILSLLGNRVPATLKVFLTALAVIDDLGAIMVIALFYSKGIVLLNLGIALGLFIVMLVLNRLRMHKLWPYLLLGAGMWYFMLHSGVHATISGVLLAFAIPFGSGGPKTISYKLQSFLHKPVSFFILPVFALANTGIIIEAGWAKELTSSESLGIFTGLVIGKPVGITLFCLMAVLLKVASLPQGLKWQHIFGAGILGGIGFTMSIFITLLAFDNPHYITTAKIAILLSSLIAAVAGLGWLALFLRERHAPEPLLEDEET
ncbi:Na+/H+ antiporter NhaA [Terrimonas ferruginea]|uniref:Na+/H+ antiporter NhaA n=1 Tax=Terrimonas ferruginea TaxID=249 RepID=UPI00042098AA|nr:Na+/H+ antiporter NhaA [Terrimonas ferruginea]